MVNADYEADAKTNHRDADDKLHPHYRYNT